MTYQPQQSEDSTLKPVAGDEMPLSMSMFARTADYWQAMYERREREANKLSEQIIKLRREREKLVAVVRAAHDGLADAISGLDLGWAIASGEGDKSAMNKIDAAQTKLNALRAALEELKP